MADRDEGAAVKWREAMLLLWAANAVGGTIRAATHTTPGIFGSPWWGWWAWAVFSLFVLVTKAGKA